MMVKTLDIREYLEEIAEEVDLIGTIEKEKIDIKLNINQIFL